MEKLYSNIQFLSSNFQCQISNIQLRGGKTAIQNQPIQSFDLPNSLDMRRYLNVTQEIDPT